MKPVKRIVVALLNRILLFATPRTVARQVLCPRNFPGQNTGVGSHFLFQGIFLTRGSNLPLLHCRRILYHERHLGSPLKVLRGGKWDSLSGFSMSGGNLFLWASLICSKNQFYLSDIIMYVQWFFTVPLQFRSLYYTKINCGRISSLSNFKKFLKHGFQLERYDQIELL